MRDEDMIISGRSMRWYEWLIALLLLALACGARADAVYKCTDSAGAIAFQATPCAQARQTSVDLAPAPTFSPSPAYALPARGTARSARARDARRNFRDDRDDTSYECRVSNGEIFYRHSACPKTLSGTGTGAKGHTHGGSRAQTLTISSREISRAEACAKIHRAGAIGRRGREQDEDVSTYERNLGRDPCK